jgi:hypothetical protein
MPRPRSAAQGFLHHEANDLSRTILEQNLRGTHLDPAGHGSVEFCDEHAVLAVRTDPGQASADLDDVTRVPELAGQPRERRAVALRDGADHGHRHKPSECTATASTARTGERRGRRRWCGRVVLEDADSGRR